jgi:hypothetical protein
LAKKPRTPPPPRRVQAPQRRDSGGRTVSPGSRRNVLIAVAALAAAAIVAVIVGFLVIGRGGGTKSSASSAATAMRAAGCTFTTYPSKGRNHLQSLKYVPSRYNSFPPVSGSHYYIPAIWNFYSTPVEQTQQIHNLEHGGIVVQWGSKVPQSTVDQLRSFWQSSPHTLLFAPLPQLGNKIAVEAWTHLATCTRFNEKAFTTFRDAYRLRGPESGFSAANTQPGQ